MAYTLDTSGVYPGVTGPVEGGYTKQQWLQLPQGQRGFKTYQRYRQWWNQRHPNYGKQVIPDRKQPVAGKTAPLPTAAIPSQLNPIGNAALQAMATNQINSQINPLIAEIKRMYSELSTRTTGQFERQKAAGISDIQNAAGMYGATLGEIAKTLGPTYDYAQQQQTNIDQGIRSFLAQSGQGLTQGVQQAATEIGAPQSAAAVAGVGGGDLAGVGGVAQGTQAQAVAEGASTASRLAAERAAEMTYAQGLPGLAAGLGAQDIGRFTRDIGLRQTDALAEIAANQGNALGQLTSQVPGLVQSTFQDLLDRETQKAIARTGFMQTARQAEINRRQENKRLKLSAAELAERKREFNLSGATSGTTKKGYQFRIGRNGHMFVQDPNTGAWVDQGRVDQPVKTGGAGGGAGGKGPGSSHFRLVSDRALEIAKDMFEGGTRTVRKLNPDYVEGTGQPKYIEEKVKGAGPVPNEQAYMAVTNYWVQQYPGKPATWLAKNIAETLGAARYAKGVQLFQDPANVQKYYQMYLDKNKPTTSTKPTKTVSNKVTPGFEGGTAPGAGGKSTKGAGGGAGGGAKTTKSAGAKQPPSGALAKLLTGNPVQKAVASTVAGGIKSLFSGGPPKAHMPPKGTPEYAKAVASRSKNAQEETRQILMSGSVSEDHPDTLAKYVVQKYGLSPAEARRVVRAAIAQYKKVP